MERIHTRTAGPQVTLPATPPTRTADSPKDTTERGDELSLVDVEGLGFLPPACISYEKMATAVLYVMAKAWLRPHRREQMICVMAELYNTILSVRMSSRHLK